MKLDTLFENFLLFKKEESEIEETETNEVEHEGNEFHLAPFKSYERRSWSYSENSGAVIISTKIFSDP